MLNPLTGDLLHAGWKCCAKTLVEVGKRDIVDAGKLDMDVFFRNVTFDVLEITQAYRFFSPKNRVGKFVISMQNPKSIVPVRNLSHL